MLQVTKPPKLKYRVPKLIGGKIYENSSFNIDTQQCDEEG